MMQRKRVPADKRCGLFSAGSAFRRGLPCADQSIGFLELPGRQAIGDVIAILRPTGQSEPFVGPQERLPSHSAVMGRP